jgi:hypothetical protein
MASETDAALWSELFAVWAAMFTRDNPAALLAWLDQHPDLTQGVQPLTGAVLSEGLGIFAVVTLARRAMGVTVQDAVATGASEIAGCASSGACALRFIVASGLWPEFSRYMGSPDTLPPPDQVIEVLEHISDHAALIAGTDEAGG